MSMGSLADPFGEVRRIHPLFGAATVESKSGWVGSGHEVPREHGIHHHLDADEVWDFGQYGGDLGIRTFDVPGYTHEGGCLGLSEWADRLD